MSDSNINQEISIPELLVKFQKFFRFIWKRKITVLFWVLAFFVIGVIVAVTSEEEYEATNVIISYASASNTASAQTVNRLAGLAGIQLPGGAGAEGPAISELMIPMVLTTYPVAKKLGDKELRFYQDGVVKTGLEYFSETPAETIIDHIKAWTIQLPYRIISWMLELFAGEPTLVRPPAEIESQLNNQLSSESTSTSENGGSNDEVSTTNSSNTESQRLEHIFVNSRTSNALSQLTSRVIVSVDGNIITVTANMPDPYAAADLAQYATDILMQELVNFEVRKTEEELEHITELYKESEEKYYKTLRNLTELQDRLRNITSTTSQVELTKATGENEIARQQFGQITLSLEQKKIKLKEDTPMFAVLNPVQIPQRPSSMSLLNIVILFSILGVFLGLASVTLRGFYVAIKAETIQD